MLARADAARAEADAIDLAGASEAALSRTAELASEAMERGGNAAEADGAVREERSLLQDHHSMTIRCSDCALYACVARADAG